MDRRDFLGGILKASLPAAMSVSALGAPKAGTSFADVTSRRCLAKQLGPGYDVLGVDRSYTHFVARIGFENHVFFLKSPDGQKWQTMDFEPNFGTSKMRVCRLEKR